MNKILLIIYHAAQGAKRIISWVKPKRTGRHGFQNCFGFSTIAGKK
jgi:hypothetical protein